MICKTCGIAGDMIAVARRKKSLPFESLFLIQGDTSKSAPTVEVIRSVASLYHGMCAGEHHCDCQHKIDLEGKTLDGEAGRQSSE